MGLEAASHIDEFVISNPAGSDAKSGGDNHIRMIKDVLKTDFPDVDEAVGTIHAGTTEPALPVALKTIWHDTTLDLLKLRNAAGNGWVTLAISPLTNNSVDINAGTIDGATLTGNTVTTGTIDNTPIGATTPNTGNFTTLHATGAVTGDSTFDGRDLAADGTKLDGIEALAEVNEALASQAEAEAGVENTKTMTALRTAQAIDGYGGRPEVFTANGTYQVPDGISSVLVEARGGGGGGGGGSGGGGQGGGGGAGGTIVALITVTAGGTEAIVVGPGGAGGAANVNGTAGTASTVGGTKASAGGGGGGDQAGPGGGGGSNSTTGTNIKDRSGGAGTAGPSGAGGLADFNSPATAKGQGGRGTQSGSGLAGVDGYVIVTPLV